MSVRKRTWTTSKGVEKEAWIVDYMDQGRKRRLKSFAKKKDAAAFAATASVEIRAGVHTADSASITIAEAGKKWLETAELGAPEREPLERATVDAYRQHLRLHIGPYIGSVKLSQLSAPMVREFSTSSHAETCREEPILEPRSTAMVRKVRVSLSALLADAQERGLVARNVVRELRKTRGRRGERQADKRARGKLTVGVDIPTREEIKAIVGAAKGRWRPFLLTAIFTGLRASELRGLRWARRRLRQAGTPRSQRADRYSAIGKPKSEAGRTHGSLNADRHEHASRMEARLPEERAWARRSRLAAGKVEHHPNIIDARACADTDRGRRHGSGRRRDQQGRQAVVAAKYPGLHALRHFYASWCINRRADGGLELPPKVVQERLGHSSIMMTMDVYGHLFPRGDDLEEMAAAERSLLG